MTTSSPEVEPLGEDGSRCPSVGRIELAARRGRPRRRTRPRSKFGWISSTRSIRTGSGNSPLEPELDDPDVADRLAAAEPLQRLGGGQSRLDGRPTDGRSSSSVGHLVVRRDRRPVRSIAMVWSSTSGSVVASTPVHSPEIARFLVGSSRSRNPRSGQLGRGRREDRPGLVDQGLVSPLVAAGEVDQDQRLDLAPPGRTRRPGSPSCAGASRPA